METVTIRKTLFSERIEMNNAAIMPRGKYVGVRVASVPYKYIDVVCNRYSKHYDSIIFDSLINQGFKPYEIKRTRSNQMSDHQVSIKCSVCREMKHETLYEPNKKVCSDCLFEHTPEVKTNLTMPYGKYKGQKISSIPDWYIQSVSSKRSKFYSEIITAFLKYNNVV